MSQEHIMSNVLVSLDTRCWNWMLFVNAAGYGRIRLRNPRRQAYAHRASYEAFHGPVPDGLNVLHKCDNPSCVNPDHLFAGTQKQNIIDCRDKGRLVDNRGQKHGMAKLTEDQVREIRKWTGSYASGGRYFGLSEATVRNIIQRKSWRHI